MSLVHGRVVRRVVGFFYLRPDSVSEEPPARADHAGVRSHVSTHLEFSVVLIEAVLLLGFAIPLWARRVNQFPPGKEALLVHVVAQQFSFNYHLPGADGQFARRDVNLVSNSNPLGH